MINLYQSHSVVDLVWYSLKRDRTMELNLNDINYGHQPCKCDAVGGWLAHSVVNQTRWWFSSWLIYWYTLISHYLASQFHDCGKQIIKTHAFPHVIMSSYQLVFMVDVFLMGTVHPGTRVFMLNIWSINQNNN